MMGTIDTGGSFHLHKMENHGKKKKEKRKKKILLWPYTLKKKMFHLVNLCLNGMNFLSMMCFILVIWRKNHNLLIIIYLLSLMTMGNQASWLKCLGLRSSPNQTLTYIRCHIVVLVDQWCVILLCLLINDKLD